MLIRGNPIPLNIELTVKNADGSSLKSTHNGLPHISVMIIYTSNNCSNQGLDECQQLGEQSIVDVSSSGTAWPIKEIQEFTGDATSNISADICHDVIYMCLMVKPSEINPHAELHESDNILCQIIPDVQLMCQTGMKFHRLLSK